MTAKTKFQIKLPPNEEIKFVTDEISDGFNWALQAVFGSDALIEWQNDGQTVNVTTNKHFPYAMEWLKVQS